MVHIAMEILIDCGFKVLRVANKLYESGNDAIQSNRSLEIISAEMKRLNSSLKKTGTIAPMPDNERGLVNLAEETERCAGQLLSLLDKLKSRDPTNRLQNLRAAFRNLRKRDEKSQLKKNLDNCRRQIDTELSNLASSQIFQKLEGLAVSHKLVRDDVSAISDKVQLLRIAFENVKNLDQRILHDPSGTTYT
ncbi:hypothetical protein F4809DRAFT_641809 [Biscogniauxia mediterranea]|nr:hypothetical protein F4809DRAFT_641809 [Biscogniauxia mediterranea]